jgi:hypothetical protein
VCGAGNTAIPASGAWSPAPIKVRMGIHTAQPRRRRPPVRSVIPGTQPWR